MPASRWHLLGGGVLIAIIGLLVIILTRSPETLYPVEIKGRFGYINRSGKLVILAQFGDAGIFDNGLSPVLIGKTWGYVDKTGKIAIAPQFEVADPFSEGLALVGSRGKFGYIDKTGKYILTPPVPGSWPIRRIVCSGFDGRMLGLHR